MKLKYKLGGLFLVFSIVTFGQSDIMNLDECLTYGLENSPYMTLSRNQMELFKYDKREVVSAYLPAINAQVGVDYNAKLPVTVIPAGGLAPQEFRIKMGMPHSNSATVQLEQKIYDQSAILGVNGVAKNKVLYELNAAQTEEDLLYQIATAYYQTLIVEQQIGLLENNKKQYEELQKIMALQLEKGIIKQLDFNRIRVAYNNISAQLNLIYTTKENVMNHLKAIIGMPLDHAIEIENSKKMVEKVSLPEDSEVNISNRIDYKIQQQTIVLQELNARIIKYSFLPTLGGYARYGANAYDENFSKSFDNFYDFATIGLSLKVPIFNGLKVNTNYKKTLINIENLKAQNKIMEEGFKIEQMNAYAKLVESHTHYSTNFENLELAEEVYLTTNLSYQKGAASLTDFLNADFSYKEAQTNYLTSFINLLTSRLDYEKSKGNLKNYLNR